MERGREELRGYEQINEKIKRGDAIVMTAEEFIELVEQSGLEKAAKEVDIVTTGTFGAMCSSGAFMNFGHSEPPIKMIRCWLNDVPAYKGLAAVDAYLGAAAMSETRPFEYGGGHVIEDLVSGKEIELRAESYGTDCYPRRSLETTIVLEDLNQAYLYNPRNAYQRYNSATNSSDRILYTYMGTLLPRYGNITFSGSGQLSPLYKDLGLETIGFGTRIFLGGGVGYVVGEGTQHKPQSGFATLAVKGDLKGMSPEYLKGAVFQNYGTTLYVGIGIPIPLINMRVASTAALKDEDIPVDILDYSIPSRDRPIVKKSNYAELKSGRVLIGDKEVPSSPLSSVKVAKKIAEVLKKQIENKEFFLQRPIELLPSYREFKPLKIKKREVTVRDLMMPLQELILASPEDEVKKVARLIVEKNIDHIPIVSEDGVLIGIVTTWDLTKALAEDKHKLKEIMTRTVITAKEDERVDEVAKRMAQYHISGLPVVDDVMHVKGLITSDDISRKLVGRRAA
ncbi:MAG: homocysteine biosynthesis protein [Nitrososphaerales archaeon]